MVQKYESIHDSQVEHHDQGKEVFMVDRITNPVITKGIEVAPFATISVLAFAGRALAVADSFRNRK